MAKDSLKPNTSDLTPAKGLLALSPVVVFMLLYVAVSVAIGDFYKMPISVAMAVAAAWAVFILKGRPLPERIEVLSRSAGDSSILYMIWVFILAGAFAAVARSTGAVESAVQAILWLFPSSYVIPTLFIASCFISFAIGTSVGTVVALTPLASEIAGDSGASVAFYVAVVLGGAFFGDNLSFISDTTIAATRSQGCNMRDKFRANLWIALPAAIATLGLYVILGFEAPEASLGAPDNPWLMIPYLVVIVLAVVGVNVVVTLTAGILTAIATGMVNGQGLLDLAGAAGTGIDSMGDLIIITLLAAGMLGVIKAAGGIDWLLKVMTRRIHGRRGAQGLLAVLVGIVNLCTANNTVAIITVGRIAKDISERYGIDPRKSASLLDSATCVVQCLIPYGAQTLLATSLAGLSPAAPFPYLYYPWALGLMVLLSILFLFPRSLNRRP